MSWTCHLPTLHRTSTHMLGTHAFLVIATLRQSFTSETLDQGDPQIYPYSFLRTRVDQWTFCLYLCLFSKYVHGEPMLDTFHHIIHTGRPVTGVSTYRSTFLLSVSPCL